MTEFRAWFWTYLPYTLQTIFKRAVSLQSWPVFTLFDQTLISHDTTVRLNSILFLLVFLFDIRWKDTFHYHRHRYFKRQCIQAKNKSGEEIRGITFSTGDAKMDPNKKVTLRSYESKRALKTISSSFPHPQGTKNHSIAPWPATVSSLNGASLELDLTTSAQIKVCAKLH